MDSWTWHCWYCNRTSYCSSDQKIKEYSDIKADSTDSNKEETDSDTFDLDQDLEPTQERSYVSLQAARPDDLTEKSDVDNADSSEVETQPAVSDESNDTIAENE